MNRLFVWMLIAALSAAPGLAPGGGVGDIDNECQNHGFDFGIAKWEWDDEDEEYFLESQAAGYNTSVTGTAEEAEWTSDPPADGVLSKEGQDYQVLPGGSAGTVTAGQHDISHITLCGLNGTPVVPEFGALAGIGILIVGGILIWKKK